MEPNALIRGGSEGSVTKTEKEIAGEVNFPTGVSFTHLFRRGSRAFAYIINP